jgi:hypothetical protein
MRSGNILPVPFPPRGLKRGQSAEYISVGVTKFDQMVVDGRMPKPKIIDSLKVWDRHELDEAFGALPSEIHANPWDDIE